MEKTKFRGKEVSSHHIITKGFECGDCPNCCEIIEVLDEDEVIGRSGGRCGKWEGRNQEKPSEEPARWVLFQDLQLTGKWNIKHAGGQCT